MKWKKKAVLCAAGGAGILLLMTSYGSTVLSVRAEEVQTVTSSSATDVGLAGATDVGLASTTDVGLSSTTNEDSAGTIDDGSAAAQTGASTAEFIPSTPEMQKKHLTWEGEKAKCREALDVLYDVGISPMAIVSKLFGGKEARESQPSEPEAVQGTADIFNTAEQPAAEEGIASTEAVVADTDTVTSAAQETSQDGTNDTTTDGATSADSLGDAALAAARQAGDKLVDGASTEVEKTKKSLLDTLKENIKEAASSLVDALFAKL